MEPSEPTACIESRYLKNGDSVHDAFRSVTARDPLGHWIHVAAAVLYLGALGLDTAPASIAFAVLFVVAAIRLIRTWRVYRFLLRHDRVGWLLAAWAALHAISLLWSPDFEMGIDEVKVFDVVVTTLLLWPVIDYVVWMLAAFLVSIALQNVIQLGQALEWFERPVGDGPRLRGLMHPVSTGTFCLMAMCLHLPAAVGERGWIRWASLAGCVAAGVGLVATGSRGPWIAAAATIPLAMVSLAIRQPQTRKPLIWLVAVMAIGGVAAWPLVDDLVLARFERAQADFQLSNEGDYSTDVGYRLASWQAAWELFMDKPLLGQGAGGYGAKAIHTRHGDVIHYGTHAHSLYLQTLATTGALGFVLMLIWIACTLGRAWRNRPDHPFADGIVFALIAWLLCAVFDAPHLSGQLFGVIVALTALCIGVRPIARPLPWMLSA